MEFDTMVKAEMPEPAEPTPPEVAPPPAAPSSTAGWLGALERSGRIDAEPHRTLPCVIDEVAAVHGARPALIGTDETLTYAELAVRQNRYARWAVGRGLSRGDTVALLMGNCPDYLAIWLGLTKVGVTVALLNVNLAGAALAHCIAVATPRAVIVAADLMSAFHGARPHLATDLAAWAHGAGTDLPRIDTTIAALDGAAVAPPAPVTLADVKM